MTKIFIAEDDKYLGRLYERAFAAAGHEVELANDGQVALTSLLEAKEVPSAIILDVRLTGISGLEVLKGIRKDSRYVAVPVMVLTNSTSQETEPEFEKLGVSAYLIKIDHEPQEVVAKVEKLIKG